jgi:hypothetical protein
MLAAKNSRKRIEARSPAAAISDGTKYGDGLVALTSVRSIMASRFIEERLGA